MDATTILYKEDARYPELLRQIADPPVQLYCRGDVELLNTFGIGVVGTRKASDYGRQACSDIVGQLANNGITIVSGLAMGIDAAAHQAALDRDGKTIAVLASGIDDQSIYPRENSGLAQQIVAHGGLVISEYELGFKAQLWSFPRRNRVISGLSRGVLVIEADKDSGSLITAQSALDQNRDVFAIPGSIYWPRSVGTNWLIQEGARPVTHAQDILNAYRLRQVALPMEPNGLSTSDPVQEKILAILKSNGPTHLDTITAASEFPAHQVMAAIALLELYGRIQHQGAGIYLTP